MGKKKDLAKEMVTGTTPAPAAIPAAESPMFPGVVEGNPVSVEYRDTKDGETTIRRYYFGGNEIEAKFAVKDNLASMSGPAVYYLRPSLNKDQRKALTGKNQLVVTARRIAQAVALMQQAAQSAKQASVTEEQRAAFLNEIARAAGNVQAALNPKTDEEKPAAVKPVAMFASILR
jgi:hypothetical protein